MKSETTTNFTTHHITVSPPSELDTKHPKRTAREEDFKVKFKTELCKKWEQGKCEYGEKCAFAHGEDELRAKVHLSTNYKTKKCKQFHEKGYCMYGRRCQFLHTESGQPHTASSSTAGSNVSSRKSSFDASEELNAKQRLPIFIEIGNRSI